MRPSPSPTSGSGASSWVEVRLVKKPSKYTRANEANRYSPEVKRLMRSWGVTR
jgi:hypothetical protein